MAVLKIVPKLYQEKIPEKLKEEISLVTTGEAKYYNRLYKFFQYTDMGNMGCFVKAIYRNTERQNIKYCCYKENLSSI